MTTLVSPPNAALPPAPIATATRGGVAIAATTRSAVVASQSATPVDRHVLQKQLQAILGTPQTRLSFSVDTETHGVVVSIIDTKTGKAISQIPSEVALRIAQHLVESQQALVDTSA